MADQLQRRTVRRCGHRGSRPRRNDPEAAGPDLRAPAAEYLKPMVERCFGLAFRAGIFNPPPQSLRGRSSRCATCRRWRVRKRPTRSSRSSRCSRRRSGCWVPCRYHGQLRRARAIKIMVEGRGHRRRSAARPRLDKIRAQRAEQAQASQPRPAPPRPAGRDGGRREARGGCVTDPVIPPGMRPQPGSPAPLSPESTAGVFGVEGRRACARELTRRFAKPAKLEGGIDAVLTTFHRDGARSVLEFIVNRINQANGVLEA